MPFTPKQIAAIEAACAFTESGELDRPFLLSGEAGTGKTYVAREIAKQAGGHVGFAAFTGKAAQMLHSKGCMGAQTIHSLIYAPTMRCQKRLRALKKQRAEMLEKGIPENHTQVQGIDKAISDEEKNVARPNFKLQLDSVLEEMSTLIVDEASMVGDQVWEDLFTFRKPIIALGDPYQLPPVMAKCSIINRKPDFLLTEIHRQKKGSAILDMAGQVRRGKFNPNDFPKFEDRPDAEASVTPWKGLKLEDAAKFDQILCGANKTRRAINKAYRERVLNITDPLPQVGDRLVCLRNSSEYGIMNGQQWVATEVVEEPGFLYLSLENDDGKKVACPVHAAPFLGHDIPHYERRDAEEFDYAYAITVHKAQGSQWDRVVVVDQSAMFRNDRHKWLYTAVTRAAEQVLLVK